MTRISRFRTRRANVVALALLVAAMLGFAAMPADPTPVDATAQELPAALKTTQICHSAADKDEAEEGQGNGAA